MLDKRLDSEAGIPLTTNSATTSPAARLAALAAASRTPGE